jgi:hypothetical protein
MHLQHNWDTADHCVGPYVFLWGKGEELPIAAAAEKMANNSVLEAHELGGDGMHGIANGRGWS